MQTPLNDYYIGVDMPSALHPQSLLAWEMNGAPLTDPHGAPLRLVMPVKYGIKNIKRIAQHRVHQQTAPRLLGGAGLRLLFRVVTNRPEASPTIEG